MVDNNHGGPRKYMLKDLKLVTYKSTINLVHLYAYNYYHFLVELVPRLFLMLPLIQSQWEYGETTILMRKSKFLPLLSLLVDFQVKNGRFRFHFINGDSELVKVTENVYFPLAPRCLHAPRNLWASIRDYWSDKGILRFSADHAKTVVVYFSRLISAPMRHVVNEQELFKAIRSDNLNIDDFYVLFGNESISDTIRYVSRATVLIGPHGSGLANIVFANREANLLELHGSGYWNPCFTYLAQTLNIKHYSLQLNGSQSSVLSMGKDNLRDIVGWLGKVRVG